MGPRVPHDGAIRVLAYGNHSDAGTYADALRLASQNGSRPDVTATSRIGTLKYGFGLNVEQEITKNIGVFGRLGWNDGKTQSFAYAVIDRVASAGVSVTGTPWRRQHDTAGTAFTAAAIAGIHGQYLSYGGLDFMIGDGALRRGTEMVS